MIISTVNREIIIVLFVFLVSQTDLSLCCGGMIWQCLQEISSL